MMVEEEEVDNKEHSEEVDERKVEKVEYMEVLADTHLLHQALGQEVHNFHNFDNFDYACWVATRLEKRRKTKRIANRITYTTIILWILIISWIITLVTSRSLKIRNDNVFKYWISISITSYHYLLYIQKK